MPQRRARRAPLLSGKACQSQLIAIWILGIAWAFATIFAWFAILFTGRYPRRLYVFAVGAMRWTTRVEPYVLLLRDDYPPFTLAE